MEQKENSGKRSDKGRSGKSKYKAILDWWSDLSRNNGDLNGKMKHGINAIPMKDWVDNG